MLDPGYLDRLAEDIILLYSRLDESIALDIARRLVKNSGRLTNMALWQIKQMQEAGVLYEDVLRMVSRYVSASERELARIFRDAAAEAVEFDSRIYEAAGLTPVPVRQSPAMMQALKAGLQKTNASVKNLTATTAKAAQQTYINACNLAYMQVTSGAFDPASAVRNAIRQAQKSGGVVTYPSGHRDRLDVAIRRSVMTGVAQTCGEISKTNAESMGCDLMEITAHSGARPSHAMWQGRIVSLSGREGYLSLHDIGYGDAGGFQGCNCRHDWYPFFEGVSARAYTETALRRMEESAVDYKGEKIPRYQATQMQRAMEREIRAAKREAAALDAAMQEAEKRGKTELLAGLRVDHGQAAQKVKQKQDKLKDFIEKTGLRQDSSRTFVSGYGRAEAARAVAARKRKEKLLQMPDGRDIMEVEKSSIRGKPNSITQTINLKNGIDRNFYDSEGKQQKQISNHNHGNASTHPYGKKGEHAHDYIWDDKGRLIGRPVRELTEQERKENSGIL